MFIYVTLEQWTKKLTLNISDPEKTTNQPLTPKGTVN